MLSLLLVKPSSEVIEFSHEVHLNVIDFKDIMLREFT